MRSRVSNLAWAASSLLLLSTAVQARDVPDFLKKLKEDIIAKGDCQKKLATGFKSRDEDPSDSSYCGDLLDTAGVIYLQSPGGKLTNMDIDCDGAQGGTGDDGRCGSSSDTQSQTSFMDTVKGYGASGVDDLNAYIHSYVVFGNEGKEGWAEFDPQKNGIEPLSVMAVVCGDKLVYGVWGDENGPDGENPVVGEASIGLATACFGKSINGNAGHDENDVLYLAFTGKDAVPGAKGAKWDAKTYEEFEESLGAVGDQLVERLKSGSGGGSPSGGSGATATASAKPTATSSKKPTKTGEMRASGEGEEEDGDDGDGDE